MFSLSIYVYISLYLTMHFLARSTSNACSSPGGGFSCFLSLLVTRYRRQTARGSGEMNFGLRLFGIFFCFRLKIFFFYCFTFHTRVRRGLEQLYFPKDMSRFSRYRSVGKQKLTVGLARRSDESSREVDDDSGNEFTDVFEKQ